MSLKNLHYFPLLLLAAFFTVSSRAENIYWLEQLCGSNKYLRVKNATQFTVRIGNETLPSCHGALNIRWETQQAFWATVTVSKLSFTTSSAAGREGTCNTLQPIKLVSYDGTRSIVGPSQFSMRFFGSVQLQYARPTRFTRSDLEMIISVEPFDIEERVEWFNRHNYHNVSLEDYCSQSLFENVSDGAVRWELNVLQSRTPTDLECLTAFNFHPTNFSDPYFLSVIVHESTLDGEENIPQRDCLTQHPLSIRGRGWIHTLTSSCSVSTLMRHSEVTTISYHRKKPFHDRMHLNMTILLNDGNQHIVDRQYME